MSRLGRRSSFGDDETTELIATEGHNFQHDWYGDDDVFGFDKDGEEDLLDGTGDKSPGSNEQEEDLLFDEPKAEKKAEASAEKAKKERKPLTPLVSSPFTQTSNWVSAAPAGGASHNARLNVGDKNNRDFHYGVVTMHLRASLNDLANKRIPTILKVEPEFSGFELPGKCGEGRFTHLHAQGRIELLSSHNKFPVAIGMIVGEDLRGSAPKMCHSASGVTCHHIAMADEKVSYNDNPILLAHSDLGKLTPKYAKDYGKFLFKDSLEKSVKKIAGNKTMMEVQVGSPVYGAINAGRKNMRKEIQMRIDARKEAKEVSPEKDAADTKEMNDIKDLDDKSDHAMLTGFAYAPSTETAKAIQFVRQAFATHVNYVPLYEAFNFKLVRANVKKTNNGVKDDSSVWADFDEVQAKEKNAADENQRKAALDKQHTFSVRIGVEYVPLTAVGVQGEQKK